MDDEVTPLTILSNTALHLGGPPRTGGAVMIGHSGICLYECFKFLLCNFHKVLVPLCNVLTKIIL